MEREIDTPYVPPTSAIEKALVSMWEDATGVHPIGVEDDFFELGGDSQRALQIASMISSRYRVNMMTSTPFSQPTIRDLCDVIEAQLLQRVGELSDEQVAQLLDTPETDPPRASA